MSSLIAIKPALAPKVLCWGSTHFPCGCYIFLLASLDIIMQCLSRGMQVQQAKDALSEARHDAQKSRDALTTCQLLLAEASSSQQQLQSQCSDLQLQAEESAAQSSSSQSALEVSQDKLAASESELADTRSQVSLCPDRQVPHCCQTPCLAQYYVYTLIAWSLVQCSQGCSHCAYPTSISSLNRHRFIDLDL